MTDRLTQLQDAVNMQAEHFCNAIGVLQQFAPPSVFAEVERSQEAQQSPPPAEDYPQIPPKPHGPNDKCDVNHEFAIICSFISQFGEKLNLELDIERLKYTLEDSSTLHDDLIEIHVKLLRKRRKYFLKDQWEKALVKFALEYSYEDASEIENIGYKDTRPSVKMELLRRLMDAQFDCDSKLKSDVNLCNADDLRPSPMGRDNKGHIYWSRTDSKGNFIIFREWSMNYKSWTSVCSDKDHLDELIEQLEKNVGDSLAGEPMYEPIDQLPEIFPELFIREEKVLEESTTKKGKGKSKGRGNKKGRSLLGNSNSNSNLNSNQNPSINSNEENNLAVNLIRSDILAYPSKVNLINGFTANHNLNRNESVASDLYPNYQDSIESHVAILLNNLINDISDVNRETNTSAVNSNSFSNDSQTGVASVRPRKYTKKVKIEELPRRTSSRIQQIQMKKIAEEEEELRKKVATVDKKTEDTECLDQDLIDRENSQYTRSNRIMKDKQKTVGSLERIHRNKKRKGKSQSRRGKGKKKISWDKDDSDLSESSSTSSASDDVDDQEEIVRFDDIDDEFACEEEDANAEPVILKRARTAGKANDGDESIVKVEEDKPCGRCSKSDNPEWILLCDRCDDGFHTTCVIPPLMFIPDGDWFCPPCEHKMLLEKLCELRTVVISVLEAREREKKQSQRLRSQPKTVPVNEPVNLGARRTRAINDELAEPLALQLLDEEDETFEHSVAPRKGRKYYNSRNKRKPEKNIDNQYEVRKPSRTYSRRPFEHRRAIQDNLSETASSSDAESNKSNISNEELPMARRAKRQVSYRFKEFDDLINSAIEGDSFADNYNSEYEDPDEDINEDEEEDELAEGYKSRGKDMATIEALANQADDLFPPLLTKPSEETSSENSDEKLGSGKGKEIATSKALESSRTADSPLDQQKKGKRKKKARRLNDLDSPSCTEVETSDESFIASAASEIEEDEESNGDESGSTSIDEIISVSRSKARSSDRRKGRKSGRKLKQNRRSDYVYQDSDSDYEPCKKRRSSSKRVSYKESTDEDFSDEYSKPIGRKKKRVVASSDDSNLPWKRKNKKNKFIVDDDEDDFEDEDIDDDEEEEYNEEEELDELDEELEGMDEMDDFEEPDEPDEPDESDEQDEPEESEEPEEPEYLAEPRDTQQLEDLEEINNSEMDYEENEVLNDCKTNNDLSINQLESQTKTVSRQVEILENKD